MGRGRCGGGEYDAREGLMVEGEGVVVAGGGSRGRARGAFEHREFWQ